MFLFHADKFGFGLFVFFFQVKHFRALQEQARTYLDLLCSMCDLSNPSVKATAKDIQQTEQMVKSLKHRIGFVCFIMSSCLLLDVTENISLDYSFLAAPTAIIVNRYLSFK